MKNNLLLLMAFVLALSSATATSQTFPTCASSSSDPDGDGWGWENNQSCKVATSTSTPTCASSSSDPDGDGWGWENNKSCKVATTSATPTCASASSDPDGDGWGWENNKSCKVATSTSVPNCANASSDPNGDGWGWENNKSCKVVIKITRIMPLGDSITGAPGCWRSILWNDLAAYGYKNLDFVGTLTAQSCALQHDANNEGHGGYLATNIANNNLLPSWLQATNPDVVLMHLGTNDVWNGVSTQNILTAYTKLIGQMRAQNSRVTILVAKILPMTPSGCGACAQRVIDLNNAIPNWANGINTSQSPVKVVDQWSGFNTSADTVDGVHPNDGGNYKISKNWLTALTSVLPW